MAARDKSSVLSKKMVKHIQVFLKSCFENSFFLMSVFLTSKYLAMYGGEESTGVL